MDRPQLNMIKIIIALMFFATMTDSYAQTTKSIDLIENTNRRNVRPLTFSEDYNRDGLGELFYAEIIQEKTQNTYWVKTAMIKNGTGIIIINLNKKLEYYGKEVINQIDAKYGYVIEFIGDETNRKSLSIWIANDKGEKDSDCISLDFKQNFSLLF